MEDNKDELRNAREKELSLMKNDFYYQQIDTKGLKGQEIVRIDVMYKPLAVLGGDSYSLRKTNDNNLFLFFVDAMGKGISASITSALTTAIVNYIFDQMKKENNFDMQSIVKKYIDFIKEELLESEMVAITFCYYNRHIGHLEYATFGMPAILMVSDDDNLIKIKSNNPPISKYTDDFKMSDNMVLGIKKVLLYTDGLNESSIESGELYKDKLHKDFHDSKNFLHFINKLNKSIVSKDDDVLFFYIERIELIDDMIKKEVIPKVDKVNEIVEEINEYTIKNGASIKKATELTLALTELMMNALEHGIFGIDRDEKMELICSGDYDKVLEEYEEKFKGKKGIDVFYTVKEEDGRKVFISRIVDNGKGFDTRILRELIFKSNSFNGRGVSMSKKLLNRFYYNEKGNSINIKKLLT